MDTTITVQVITSDFNGSDAYRSKVRIVTLNTPYVYSNLLGLRTSLVAPVGDTSNLFNQKIVSSDVIEIPGWTQEITGLRNINTNAHLVPRELYTIVLNNPTFKDGVLIESPRAKIIPSDGQVDLSKVFDTTPKKDSYFKTKVGKGEQASPLTNLGSVKPDWAAKVDPNFMNLFKSVEDDFSTFFSREIPKIGNPLTDKINPNFVNLFKSLGSDFNNLGNTEIPKIGTPNEFTENVLLPFQINRDDGFISDPNGFTRLGYTKFHIPPTSINVKSENTVKQAEVLRSNSMLLEMDMGVRTTVEFQFIIEGKDMMNHVLIPIIDQFKRYPFLPIENLLLNQTYEINAVVMKDLLLSTTDTPNMLSITLVMEKFNWNYYVPTQSEFQDIFCWPIFKLWCTSRSTCTPIKGLWDGQINFLIPRKSTLEQKIEILNRTRESEEKVTTNPQVNTTDLQSKISLDALESADSLNVYDLITQMDAFTTELVLNKYGKTFKDKGEWKALFQPRGQFARNLCIDHTDINLYTNAQVKGLKTMTLYLEPKVGLNTAERNALKTTNTPFWALIPRNHPIWSEISIATVPRALINILDVDFDQVTLDPSIYVNNISLQMSNQVTSLKMDSQEDPVHQFLGSTNAMIGMTLEVVGEKGLHDLKVLIDKTRDLAYTFRANPDALDYGGFLKIHNEILNLAGVEYIIPMSMTSTTVEGTPHLYKVQLDLIQYDPTQRNLETAEALEKSIFEKFAGATSGAYDTNFIEAARKTGLIPNINDSAEFRIYRSTLLKRRLASVDLYPDMKLPTHEEVGQWIKLIQEYLGPNTRKYNDYETVLIQAALSCIDDEDIPKVFKMKGSTNPPIGYVDPDFCMPLNSDSTGRILNSNHSNNFLLTDRFGGKYYYDKATGLTIKFTDNQFTDQEDNKFVLYEAQQAIQKLYNINLSPKESSLKNYFETNVSFYPQTSSLPTVVENITTRNYYLSNQLRKGGVVTHATDVSNIVTNYNNAIDRAVTLFPNVGKALLIGLIAKESGGDKNQRTTAKNGHTYVGLGQLEQEDITDLKKTSKAKIESLGKKLTAFKLTNPEDNILVTAGRINDYLDFFGSPYFALASHNQNLNGIRKVWLNYKITSKLNINSEVDNYARDVMELASWYNGGGIKYTTKLADQAGKLTQTLQTTDRLHKVIPNNIEAAYVKQKIDLYLQTKKYDHGALNPLVILRYTIISNEDNKGENQYTIEKLSYKNLGEKPAVASIGTVTEDNKDRFQPVKFGYWRVEELETILKTVQNLGVKVFVREDIFDDARRNGIVNAGSEALEATTPITPVDSEYTKNLDAFAKAQQVAHPELKVPDSLNYTKVTRVYYISQDPSDSTIIDSELNIEQAIDHMKTTINDHKLIRAFPSYFVSIIDGARWIGVDRAMDHFYGGFGINSIDVVASRKTPVDVATIIFSNFYGRLTSLAADIAVQKGVDTRMQTWFERGAEFKQFFSGKIDKFTLDRWLQFRETIMLKPGARLHIRLGYGNNAAALPVVFNGTITEVPVDTPYLQITAIGDGHQLMAVIPDNDDHIVEETINDERKRYYNNTGHQNTPKEPGNIVAELFIPEHGELASLAYGAILSDSKYNITNFGDYDYSGGIPIRSNGENGCNIYTSSEDPNQIGEGWTNWCTLTGTIANLRGYTLFGVQAENASPWDIANICARGCPDHFTAVRPFEFRSTLYWGGRTNPFYYAYKPLVKGEHNSDTSVAGYRAHMYSRPFSSVYTAFSHYNLISMNIVADASNMYTNCQAKYIYGGLFGENTSVKEGDIMKTDINIFPEQQKTLVVQSGLLSGPFSGIEGIASTLLSLPLINSLKSSLDPVNTSSNNYASSVIRDSVSDMYQGTILMLGEPHIFPYDFMYINCLSNRMNGPIQVKDRVHHFSIDNGFVTAVSPDACVFQAGTHNLSFLMGCCRKAIALTGARTMQWQIGKTNRKYKLLTLERLKRYGEGPKNKIHRIISGLSEEEVLAANSKFLSFEKGLRDLGKTVTKDLKNSKAAQWSLKALQSSKENARKFIDGVYLGAKGIEVTPELEALYLTQLQRSLELGELTAEEFLQASELGLKGVSPSLTRNIRNKVANSASKIDAYVIENIAKVTKEVAQAEKLLEDTALIGLMILQSTVGDAIYRSIASRKSLVIVPLTINGREYTAGINGHMGAVIGDPISWNDSWLASIVDPAAGYEEHGWFGLALGLVANIILPDIGGNGLGRENFKHKIEDFTSASVIDKPRYDAFIDGLVAKVKANQSNFNTTTAGATGALTSNDAINSTVAKILKKLNDFKGATYRNGGNSTKETDCSYLVQQLYAAVPKALPRTAEEQRQKATPINPSARQPGDLVFLKNTQPKPGATHVGILLPGDQVVATSSIENGIVFVSYKEFTKNNFLSIGRP